MLKLKKKKKSDETTADASDESNSKPADAADGTEESDASPKSKKKLFIIIGAVVVLLGGGAGAYFGGLIGGKPSTAEATVDGEQADAQTSASKQPNSAEAPVFFELPEFLVNLNTSGKQSSFLKMSISVQLSSQEDQAVLEANMPKILDTFNTYLRELRASDLYGSAGIYRLREELLSRINKIVAPVQVKDILFKQVLVQ